MRILRDASRGSAASTTSSSGLGVSRGVLTARLDLPVRRASILERRRYQERPERFEYRLTEKGRDLWPVTMALMQWGDSTRPRRPAAAVFAPRLRRCR